MQDLTRDEELVAGGAGAYLSYLGREAGYTLDWTPRETKRGKNRENNCTVATLQALLSETRYALNVGVFPKEYSTVKYSKYNWDPSAYINKKTHLIYFTDIWRFTTMEEDLTIPHDSAKNCNFSVRDDEKEKVKDFVYKHLREVTDGSLFNNAEECSIKEHGSSTKKDKQTLNKGHCKIQQGAVFSGKILSFECSVCKDDSTYSPNDLLKHFRAAHKGTLPTYPCDLCSFVTNEFPALQRHRIEHRNTLVTCELCNDDVQYSLLLLTRHYIMCHSLNGQFNCDWCEFTTVDAGTFVQHIHHHNESPWKCSKCRHISLNDEDHQKHMKAHSGTFPFTCQICGYGAARMQTTHSAHIGTPFVLQGVTLFLYTVEKIHNRRYKAKL
ncbi:hypothetical protein L3Q82_001066 [Scortum barcoo]|uniref:Uncharacterized protein n=1 Tax=Scortum barcoo TaxID=214431 RepID=A0ACB8WC63_9TELE|nr:hypothetical protein L3Q82_001066 [Scortum barcoo]